MKAKDWGIVTKWKIDKEKILETGFGKRNYISAEEKPPVSSFREIEHKDRSIIYLNILNGLL